MIKILVLYHSNSGNTATMAQLVARGAQYHEQVEVREKSIDQANDADILWCDGLAVGCPTNLGTLSWPMKKFWDDRSRTLWGKVDGKIACAFSSAGSYGGGAELTCFSLTSLLINYGFLVFGVTEFTGRRFSPHYGAICAGSPEQTQEQNACLLLGQQLAQWAGRNRAAVSHVDAVRS
ncbi:MAG TPA: flavodoxin family protein [Gammaproteobacteria bacterium]|nr:flavodoxin family protein [Gammaproteobacteria bacterium]